MSACRDVNDSGVRAALVGLLQAAIAKIVQAQARK